MGHQAKEQNPYVGPRSFEKEDRPLFFGRDREANDLLSLVIAHQAVLLYAQSGAGKTSLLKALLTPLLEEEDFEVWPLARVQGLIPPELKPQDIENLYVFNTLVSWSEGGVDANQLTQMTLAQFFAAQVQPTDDFDMAKPQVVIFDQFEEVFTSYPERWPDREKFFKQVQDALEKNPLLRVVFSMREDFIAQMDPYVGIFRDKLRTRQRLERLRQKAALAAVEAPLKETTDRYFGPRVAEQLVENLRKGRAETVLGQVEEVTGEFIEPVQLQVVCQRLWQELPKDALEITSKHLQTFGDVDQALSDFYEQAIAQVRQKSGVREGKLRQWFDQKLLTSAGTRSMVHREAQTTGELANNAVDELENLHLIRAERRAGAQWYELTHDRFIAPIQKANQEAYQRSRKRLWKRSAIGLVSGIVLGTGGWLLERHLRIQQDMDLVSADSVDWQNPTIRWALERLSESGASLKEIDLRNANLSNTFLYNANLRDADLRDANLRDADLRDANLRNTDLRNTDLRNADLRDADLRNADLRNANLSNANLSGTIISDTTQLASKWRLVHTLVNEGGVGRDLRNANLSNANLSNANLSNANLSNANLSNANLSGTIISDTTQLTSKWRLVHTLVNEGGVGRDLSNTNLSNANLSNTDLSNTDLSNTDLSNANLNNADLSNADLNNADLSNTDLSNTDLSNATLLGSIISDTTQLDSKWRLAHTLVNEGGVGRDLTNADLSNTDLSNADLSNADLRDADLSNADLSNADLSNAELFSADLYFADLSNTNLSNADLSNADLSNTNFIGTIISDTTQLDSKWRLAHTLVNEGGVGRDLTNADLSSTNLSNTDLSNADLSNADLRNADLRNANLSRTIISDTTQLDSKWRLVHTLVNEGGVGRDLRDADLRDADLRNADLRNADLSDANLRGANLSNVNLHGAYLRNTYLRNADLRNTNLSDADLNSSILFSTNLGNSKNLTVEQLTGNDPPFLCKSVLPDHITDAGIDPNRDCDKLPQVLSDRFDMSLEYAQQFVEQARQKTWE